MGPIARLTWGQLKGWHGANRKVSMGPIERLAWNHRNNNFHFKRNLSIGADPTPPIPPNFSTGFLRDMVIKTTSEINIFSVDYFS